MPKTEIPKRKFPAARIIRRRWTRWAAGLTTAAAVVVAPVAAAGLAEAWPGDPHVTLSGLGSCKTVALALDTAAREVRVTVNGSGESVTRTVNPWTAYWQVPLTTIPDGGSWVDVWLNCAVPGVSAGWRFAGQRFVSRPLVGSYAAPVWQSA